MAIAKNMVTLPPGTITIRSGWTSTPRCLRHVGGHGLAQRQDAVGRRVAVMAVAQRLDRGLDDVRRGREVRLADAEIDDRPALLLQARRPRQHLEGALGAEPADRRGELHLIGPPGYEGGGHCHRIARGQSAVWRCGDGVVRGAAARELAAGDPRQGAVVPRADRVAGPGHLRELRLGSRAGARRSGPDHHR